MKDFSYKQQLQIPCGTCSPHKRAFLIDSTIHGYICCIVDGAVLCYHFHRFLDTIGSCNLRRDKTLSSHPADIVLECRVPAVWIAFNSTGLIMAVLTSHAERGGTFVNLIQLVDAIKKGPRLDLAQCAFRSIRVCGGEHGVTVTTGVPGLEPCDFSWNPTVENSFVVCLHSGSLRLFEVNQSQATSNMVGHLPSATGATCVSWSPKGKQLAVCLTGSLSTSSGTVQGPLFLQTDAQLRVKRMVSLTNLLKEVDGGAYPLDLLWTSPSCFLLGVHSLVGDAMRTLFVSAPVNSQNPPTCSEIADLRGPPGSSSILRQYYFRLLSNTNYAVASLSATGEEILLLKLPTPADQSAGSNATSCQPVVHMELPPSGSILGLTVGFSRTTDNSATTILLSYLSVILTSGNICTYLFHSPSLLAIMKPSLPKPVELPVLEAAVNPPESADTLVNSTAGREQPSQDRNQEPHLRNQGQQQNQEKQMEEQNVQSKLQLEQEQQQQRQEEGKPAQEKQHQQQPHRSNPQLQSVPNPVQPAQGRAAVGDSAAVNMAHSPLYLPKSVRLATSNFTAALQSEAEAGRTAWHDLRHTMQHGLPLDGEEQKVRTTSQSAGVCNIEAQLQDAANFLQSLEDVNSELMKANQDRKADLSNAMNYAECVRRVLRLCSMGDWTPALLNNRLDPKASRLLCQLQRHGRLLESGLLELESQIESEFFPATAKQANWIRTLKMTDKLILTERNRVDYLLQSLGRLCLDDTAAPASGDQKKPPVRRGTAAQVEADEEPSLSSSPWFTHLVHRDRTLFRLLFAANHNLRVVHAQSSYPPALPERDAQPDGGSPQSESPIILSKGQVVSHPQHTKLEQLIQRSAQAAVASSPPRNLVVEHSAPSPVDRPPSFTSGSDDTPQSPATPILGGIFITTASQSTLSNSGFVLGQKAATPPTIRPTSSASAVFSTGTAVSPTTPTTSTVASSLRPATIGTSSPATPSASAVRGPSATSKPNGPPPNITVTTNSFIPPPRHATAADRMTFTTSPSAAQSVQGGGDVAPPSLGNAVGYSPSALSELLSAPGKTIISLASSRSTSASVVPSVASSPTPVVVFNDRPVDTAATIGTSVFSSKPIFGGLTEKVNTGSLFSGSKPVFGGMDSTAVSVASTLAPGSTATVASASASFSLFSSSTLDAGGKLFGQLAPASTAAVSLSISSTASPARSLFGTNSVSPPVTSSSTDGLCSKLQASPLTSSSSGGGLFGTSKVSPISSGAASPGGLFEALSDSSPKTTSVNLCVSPSSTVSSSPGGLFGSGGGTLFTPSVTVGVTSPPLGIFGTATCSGSLFGTSPSTLSTSPGGLFGAPKVSCATAPSTNGLFADLPAGSPANAPTGLFGAGVSNTVQPIGGLFASMTTTSVTSTTGLFQHQQQQAAPATGLFGVVQPASSPQSVTASTTSAAGDISSLFSTSSFGLGGANSPAPAAASPFGRPLATAPGSTSIATPTTGLFGSAAQPTGNLFGAPAFTVKPQQPSAITTTTSFSLFGSSTTSSTTSGGGLFANSKPATAGAGFGVPPTFGTPVFGAAAGGLFAGSAAFTSGATPSLFGATTQASNAAGGAGLFASLAAMGNSPSFGSLANGAASPQQQSTPAAASLFSTSPSFTQRRA